MRRAAAVAIRACEAEPVVLERPLLLRAGAIQCTYVYRPSDLAHVGRSLHVAARDGNCGNGFSSVRFHLEKVLIHDSGISAGRSCHHVSHCKSIFFEVLVRDAGFFLPCLCRLVHCRRSKPDRCGVSAEAERKQPLDLLRQAAGDAAYSSGDPEKELRTKRLAKNRKL
jgi:hypothetical protein